MPCAACEDGRCPTCTGWMTTIVRKRSKEVRCDCNRRYHANITGIDKTKKGKKDGRTTGPGREPDYDPDVPPWRRK